MKVSIITVAYNSANTIETTINSVLNQTHKDIEYIIVDGNSNDDTLNIIRKYEVAFEGRMSYVSEKDCGIYDAMNKGLKMAQGDVVGILNSDDFFSDTTVVENFVKEFDNNIDAVYGDVHFVKGENLNKCVRYYSSAIFRPWLLRFGFMPAHPSFYVRKEIYEKYGYYSLDYKIAADYDIMVRFIYNHKIKAKYIKMDFVTMRTGGMSNQSIKNRLITSKEDVKACTTNGLYTNIFFVCFKYFFKVFEFKPFK
jgi:glycosyltransferase involved in cell wall biosynthesis